MDTEIGRIEFNDGTSLTLVRDGEGGLRFEAGYPRSLQGPRREALEDLAVMGTRLVKPPHYHPTPADGVPGVEVAQEMARNLKARYVGLYEPVTPPGVEY